MPHVELYIADQICDLQGDEKVQVDYAIFDIDKIDSRGGIRSYEFELPKTNRNKTVLENPEMVSNTSLLPYSRISARLLVDGVDMLIRFAEIQSVKGAYRIRLYGSNSGFYEKIKDLYLMDLSKRCSYQHHWVWDNVIGSRHNTSGYIYPLVDWHNDAPNAFISDTLRQIETNRMLPCLFYEELIQNIVEDAGYSYENNSPSDETMLLPCSEKPKRNTLVDLYEGEYGTNTDLQLQICHDGGLQGWYWSLGFDYNVAGCGSYWDAFFVDGLPDANHRITFANKISFTVEWEIQVENTSPFDFAASIVLTTELASTINPLSRNSNNFHEEFFSFPSGQTVTLTGTCDLITDAWTTYIFNSHYIDVVIGGVYKNAINLYINEKAGSKIRITNVQVLQENAAVDYFHFPVAQAGINTYFTVGGSWDIKQIDLLKQYCLLLGLIIIVDDYNGRIIFEKFDKVLENFPSALDWSNKIDLSEDAEIVFIGGSYGQNSNFTWESDDPEAKPVGTDGVILIDNKNLEKNVDVVALDYASSYFQTLLNGLDVPVIPVFSGGVAQNDLTQRVLYLKKYAETDLIPSGALTYYEQDALIVPEVVSDDIPIAWFINKDQQNNLGFANNILDTRYNALSKIIPKYKNVKLLIRLSAADINQLNFLIPIWIQKYEAYFYISSIKGFSYTESKSTLVELVKINING